MTFFFLQGSRFTNIDYGLSVSYWYRNFCMAASARRDVGEVLERYWRDVGEVLERSQETVIILLLAI